MSTSSDYDEYLAEIREQVCRRCIERQPNAPPCAPRGKPCGIELHLPAIIEICRTTDSALIDPYIEALHDKICAYCELKDKPSCPCPLDYLLLLAVEAVETVGRRQEERLTTGTPPLAK
jgi:hypothetical protein